MNYFMSEYQSEPCSRFSKEAYDLAEEYHRRTEEYDRKVCTGPIVNGSIRPATGDEIASIGIHARYVYQEILRKAVALGITPKEFHRLIVSEA